MPKPSDLLPQYPWEGPPVPRGLKKKSEEDNPINEADVKWSKLSDEQKVWLMNYLMNWKQGIKRFYGLSDDELKEKFRTI